MIELKQIRKDYGERTVIKNQSLSIKDKEFFVLIGPSGSGKTTLLKLINRLIDPTEGDVLLNGKSVMDYPLRKLRLNTGYVLQQIALFPNLTVAENIELVPIMKKWPKQIRKEQTTQLLSKVGLDPKIYAHRYPHELSGGEQQRVGIVRAIIGKPEILLMDEPFSALDPISRRQLQDLIKTLHHELGLTIVFVTHNMEEAAYLGDRLCIMNHGESFKPEHRMKSKAGRKMILSPDSLAEDVMALNNLFTVFTGRIQDWLLALTQHVQISLSALLAAIFISIPLGILLSRKNPVRRRFCKSQESFRQFHLLPFWDL